MMMILAILNWNRESIKELPKKQSHKRFIKNGTSLFLPEDFLADHRLVRADKELKLLRLTDLQLLLF